MSTGQDDGVYRTERRRVQRRKKLAVAVTGLAAIAAGGGWAVSAWQTARNTTIIGDTGALAPAVTVSPSASSAPRSTAPTSASPSPSTRSAATRLSGARRSSRPSPTPSVSMLPDEDLASAQVSRLLRAPQAGASGGVSAAGESIVVANEPGADGSAVRVVSARYDLTGRGALLLAADTGERVGDARCTRNLRVDGAAAETRPSVLLCWRVSPARSVVTVATIPTGSPAPASSARIIDRVWRRLD